MIILSEFYCPSVDRQMAWSSPRAICEISYDSHENIVEMVKNDVTKCSFRILNWPFFGETVAESVRACSRCEVSN